MRLPDAPRVFVTGGGSGLGRALALELADRGARVLIGDVNTTRAEETAALVAQRGGSADTLRCDVTQVTDLEAAAARMDALWGGTDLLINNAGVAAGGYVGEIPLADWEWILRVNLWGVIHGCHVFAPRMKERRQGAILNVASSAGLLSMGEMASYNVGKAGVVSLSETLYVELAQHGIAVSVLCPTFFATNLMENFRSPAARQRNLAEAFFARASMSAEQVARAALRGLEHGELVVVPQLDGRLAWRLKRFAPWLYQWLLRTQHRAMTERLLRERARAGGGSGDTR